MAKPKSIAVANAAQFRLLCAKEDKRHDKAIKRLEEALKVLQSTCPHKRSHFQGDPSGGQDSCQICDDCDYHW